MLCALGYEIRRILTKRACVYGLLVLLGFAWTMLHASIIDGVYGTAPYSPLSYAQYLVFLCPLLLCMTALWCGEVYSERQRALRRIVLATPVTPAAYIAIKAAAIVAVVALAAALLVAESFVFYGWHFGFFRFGRFFGPIFWFLIAPAVLVLGLAFAAGHLHPRLPQALVPVLFFAGVFNLDLPPWMDICGNNFLSSYAKMLLRNLGRAEIVYHLPNAFIASRILFITAGIALLFWAARRCRA